MENQKEEIKLKFKPYWPLFCLILVTALEATALNSIIDELGNRWMNNFMGLFLCQFAMLKLFDLEHFSIAFAKYDIFASKSHAYALCYPFIELGLGLSFLSFGSPQIACFVTAVLFGLSAFGVIKALKGGLDVKCACMGTILNVPLSHVTLAEDIIMFIMALILLLTM